MRRGYTVLEMLIAVAVTAVGFAAIFSMQISTLQGNASARDFGAATSLAERYVEQLRQDTFEWVVPAAPPAPFLNRGDRQWHTFTPVPVDHNNLANVDDVGDQGSALNRQRFCVHFWLEPLQGNYTGLMNARVRVVWPRDPARGANFGPACDEGEANGFAPGEDWYSLTVPASLRMHASGT